jgi:hypothetical protein
MSFKNQAFRRLKVRLYFVYKLYLQKGTVFKDEDFEAKKPNTNAIN